MIYVMLPIYNEERNVIPVINDIVSLDIDTTIICVDDGSTDASVENIKSLNLKNVILINHKNNKGLGQAIKTGFDYVLDNGKEEDFVVTMDTDQSHPVSLINDFITTIKGEGGCDCVIGSRFVEGGTQQGVNIFRRFLSKSLMYLMKILFRHNVRDVSSGFRMYRISSLKKLKEIYKDKYIEESDFACMAEILLKLLKIGCKICEVPMQLRYDYKLGKSKIKFIKTIFGYLRIFFKSYL